MWFVVTFYMVFIVLSIIVYKEKIFAKPNMKMDRNPFVTLLIPAYNEEADVAETLKSLHKVSYKNVEFLFLNDGSKDKTSEIITKHVKALRAKGDMRFRFIDNKINKGKAATLNQGIALAKGEYVACMDADTVVEKNIFQKVIPEFHTKNIAAVTVAVEVSNKRKWLNKVIGVEFNLGLGLLLRVFSFSGVVWVTPGPFSMYRKYVLDEIGGFDPNSITEDHEIAFRIYKAGYVISNTMNAKVWATMPETFKGSYIQRRRWYSGSIITMLQHRKMLAKPKYGLFSFFIPYNMILIFLSLIMFGSTVGLALVKIVKNIILFSHTGFNFFAHWSWDYSLFYLGRVNILGFLMFAMVVVFIAVGLTASKVQFRKNAFGILLFPFFFFLYQIYWWGAVISTITKGGKIKWR